MPTVKRVEISLLSFLDWSFLSTATKPHPNASELKRSAPSTDPFLPSEANSSEVFLWTTAAHPHCQSLVSWKYITQCFSMWGRVGWARYIRQTKLHSYTVQVALEGICWSFSESVETQILHLVLNILFKNWGCVQHINAGRQDEP